MSHSSFVHLNVHTEYSLVDSVVRIPSLVQKAVDCHMPAVAITDEMALFGMVKFYKAAQNKGIKPIIGADLLTDEGRLTLICENEIGYRHLTQIISKAYQCSWSGDRPVVPWSWFEEKPEWTKGLIAFALPDQQGLLSCLFQKQEIHWPTAEQWVKRHAALFPNSFYLALCRSGGGDPLLEDLAFDFADHFELPVVATGQVRFLEPADFDAHEARVAIGAGYKLTDSDRPRAYHPNQYFQSDEEIRACWEDAPFVIENAFEISKRCQLELRLNQVFLPRSPIPDERSMEEYLQESSQKGLQERLTHFLKVESTAEQKYWDRLAQEVSVIAQMGFAGYFLIVANFIGWAKKQGIPVGPGRGSGAGSLVAYALGITDLDPLAYDLLFERFLNPERVSMPDFDIDFCMDGRDRVIQYVAETYGRESVSQIITFGSMAAKAVIRDVGRVLDQPYGFVDKIAKLVPFELGITLQKALQDEPLLQKRYEEEEEVKALLDLAMKLEGLTRNVGKHAGGVVIAPSRLTNFVPLYFEQGTQVPVSQFDKDDVETIGLVKFDFLGLKTLTIIDSTLKRIKEPIRIEQIPLTDAPTFELLCSGHTTAVFQLESQGMKDLIMRLKPDCFEDIVALVALYRPGPLQSGMVDDFIARKQGIQEIVYPHPDLEPILKPTYGVILYQEQVMQIAQVLAGYTLGQADLLRRAMGKKKPEEMMKQRAVFKEGAANRGVSEELAASIFDLMEKFAGYGFNKSHSAAYALISYQTAWLKAHYPEYFMAAVLSAEMHHTDKVVYFLEECHRMGINVLKPDIASSAFDFTVTPQKEIQYGLGAIKGVGEGAVMTIVQAREKSPFKSFFDFCHKVDLKKANKRTLEALILAGALDAWGNRSTLMASLERAMSWGEKSARDAAMGQMDLFALMEEADPTFQEPSLLVCPPESFDLRLKNEKKVLGHYLSGHPMDPYLSFLQAMRMPYLNQLRPTEKAENVRVAGLIQGLRMKKSQEGKAILFATLADQTAQLDIAFFGEILNQYREQLQAEEVYCVEGRIRKNPFNGRVRLSVNALYPLKTLKAKGLKKITLQWGHHAPDTANQLKALLADHVVAPDDPAFHQACLLELCYQKGETRCSIALGPWGFVRPSQALLDALEPLFPHPNQWSLTYDF